MRAKQFGAFLIALLSFVVVHAGRASGQQAQQPDGASDEEFAACDPCCTLCPCFYVTVEGLLMDRNNRTVNQPLVLDLNTQETLLSTSNLNPDVGAGFRVLAGKRIGECLAIELGYFGLFGMTSNASVVGEGSLMMPGDLGLSAVNNFFGADRVDITYSSNLQGAEANLVCCHCCCDDCPPRSREWFVGFRYINLNENFSLTSIDSAEGTSRYAVQTQNHLYGGQVGGRLRRCYGRWSVEGTGKAGLFGNDASQRADAILDFPDNFVVRPAVGANQGQLAFVGELNLTGVYQINSVWGLRAGYNLIWIDGVALAPDQLDFSNTPTSGTSIVSTGSVFLHGVSAGIEARW